jgi:hypothetical protein
MPPKWTGTSVIQQMQVRPKNRIPETGLSRIEIFWKFPGPRCPPLGEFRHFQRFLDRCLESLYVSLFPSLFNSHQRLCNCSSYEWFLQEKLFILSINSIWLKLKVVRSFSMRSGHALLRLQDAASFLLRSSVEHSI